MSHVERAPRIITGRQVLFGFIASFAVVFAVNGYMIYEALSTFDGLEVSNPYEKGREYNNDLNAMTAQKALGWTSTINVEDNGRNHDARLVVTFVDKNGAPLKLLRIRAGFIRPVVGGMDQSKMMTETSPGRYEADFALAASGNWIAQISALGSNGEKFAEKKRVFVHD